MNQKRLMWLLEKLQSPDEVARWSATERLAQLQSKESALPLLHRLTDSDFRVLATWDIRSQNPSFSTNGCPK